MYFPLSYLEKGGKGNLSIIIYYEATKFLAFCCPELAGFCVVNCVIGCKYEMVSISKGYIDHPLSNIRACALFGTSNANSG